MNLVLSSIFSRKSQSAGLMIYDLDNSFARYLQLVDFSGLPVRMYQLRGISVAGDRFYALTPSTMLIFRIKPKKNGPAFALEKIVYRPEWVIGDNLQGNLHAVFASQERKSVYISFNTQCALDVFDLEGNFLHRQNLWEIAPNLFQIPSKFDDRKFRYGLVMHIFESENNEILLTTSKINGTENSAIISYDAGKIILNEISQPIHGGLIHRNKLYLCAIQKGEVQTFIWPGGESVKRANNVMKFCPSITDNKWKGSEQKTRGLAVLNNHIFCGVSYFGKPKTKQIPPRMVEFNLKNGQQLKEHWLPSFKGMEDPHIYALLPVSNELEQLIKIQEEPRYFNGDSYFTPIWKNDNEKVVKTKRSLDNNFENNEFDNESKKTNLLNLREVDIDKKKLKNNCLESNILDYRFKTHSDKEENKSKQNKKHIINACISNNIKKQSATVIFENVGLCFERAARKFLSFNKNLRIKKDFWALRNVSFTVLEGETLGVIGRNGSGKSTLSMICSGVLTPDKGRVIINGRTQLLALGVGFKTELSGRENVFISGSLLGLSKREIINRMDEIEEFAELGEFMDEPVRTYSSGMRSRLGFAVATTVKPDILILDEVMATGDRAFRNKAMQRMREMRNLARSIIVVSHNPGQLRKLSTKVLWLEKGRMLKLSEPKEVLNAYENFCKNPERWLRNHKGLG